MECNSNTISSTFPDRFHGQISVIHDGIDTKLASRERPISSLVLPNGLKLSPSETLVTFVNRKIEPYRGCHTFIRSIPSIQRACPDARIVIVGGHDGVSYGKAHVTGNWRDHFLSEIQGQYDPDKVSFVGTLDYKNFLDLLKMSSCHVYLTYPFVLSWSLLEAMSMGLPVVGSSTSPVEEVISDGDNGLLVDFFSPDDLACAVAEMLNNRENAKSMGDAARQTIYKNIVLKNVYLFNYSLCNWLQTVYFMHHLDGNKVWSNDHQASLVLDGFLALQFSLGALIQYGQRFSLYSVDEL